MNATIDPATPAPATPATTPAKASKAKPDPKAAAAPKPATAQPAAKAAKKGAAPKGHSEQIPDAPPAPAPEKPAPAKVKPAKKEKAPKVAPPAKPKRVSALDAAAKVLAKAGKPMKAAELIEAMASQGLWTSPGGKTPEATLYAAVIREIATKKHESRFKKHDRGLFVAAHPHEGA